MRISEKKRLRAKKARDKNRAKLQEYLKEQYEEPEYTRLLNLYGDMLYRINKDKI